MTQVQSEEMMSRNCRKHVRDRPNDMIVNNTLRDRIARSDDRKKGSSQGTSPFYLLLKQVVFFAGVCAS